MTKERILSKQNSETSLEQRAAPIVRPEQLATIPGELGQLADEIELNRQQISQLDQQDGPTLRNTETVRIFELVKQSNALRMQANTLIEKANEYMPDDRLESGRSVYGKILTYNIPLDLLTEAVRAYENYQSETEQLKLKIKLQNESLDEVKHALANDAATLARICDSLQLQEIQLTKNVSGLKGIWNQAFGQLGRLYAKRTQCRIALDSIKNYLESATKDGKISLTHTRQLDELAHNFQDPAYQEALQAAGLNAPEVVDMISEIKNKISTKNKRASERHGVERTVVAEAEKRIRLLLNEYRQTGPGTDAEKYVEKWTAAQRIFGTLGVNAESEETYLQQAKDREKPEALRTGDARTFRNIRESIFLYAEKRRQEGLSPDAVAAEIATEAARVQETLSLSYNEQADDALRILSSGRILNLFEHDPSEQEKRKKSMSSLSTLLAGRQNVHEALGWEHNDQVYHLAVDDSSDEETNGRASEYGSIRFQFEYQKFAEHSTFTESDSLNPRGLPLALGIKSRISSATRGVEDRQISALHVPYAKAIFNLLEKQAPTRDGKEMRYIEAQVGSVSGTDLIKAVKSIKINMSEFTQECTDSHIDTATTLQQIKKFCRAHKVELVELPHTH